MDRIVDFVEVAHRGQVDKAGNLMSDHAKRVADIIKEKGLSEIYIHTALMHDVFEDTDYTVGQTMAYLDNIRAIMAIPYAVELARNKEKETYFEYILRVAMYSHITLEVKMADIEDHLTDRRHISKSLISRYKSAGILLRSIKHEKYTIKEIA